MIPRLSIALLALVGGCPAPETIPAPPATERLRERCYWVDDGRLADVMASVQRDMLAGVPRDEIEASIARFCKDRDCQACAAAVVDEIFSAYAP